MGGKKTQQLIKEYNGYRPRWPRGVSRGSAATAGIEGSNPTGGMDVCLSSV
jgi:hypothetical protein